MVSTIRYFFRQEGASIVESNQTIYSIDVEAFSKEEALEKITSIPSENWEECDGEVVKQDVQEIGIWQPRSPILYGADWSRNNHTNQVRSILTRLSELTLPEAQKISHIYSAQTKVNPLKKIFTDGYAYGNLQRQTDAMAQDVAEYVDDFLPPLLTRLSLDTSSQEANDIRAVVFYTIIAITMREDLSRKEFRVVTKAWLKATAPWVFPEPTGRSENE